MKKHLNLTLFATALFFALPAFSMELSKNDELLFHGINNGALDIVKTAVREGGANVNAIGKNHLSVLASAVQGNKPSIVKYLIEKGADVNAISGYDNATPLAYAPSAEIVNILVDNGADVNAKNSRGYTPLASILFTSPIAKEYIIQVARALLERGANPKVTVGESNTPLLVRAKKQFGADSRIVMLLEDYSVRVK